MIVRAKVYGAAPRTAARVTKLLRWSAGLAASGVAALILVGAISDNYAISRPQAALAWNSKHPEALVEAAERHFEAGDPADDRPAAFALARRAMISNPLAAAPLRLLGLEAEERGDEARAHELMQLAVERSPRDLKAQIWLADHALLAGDFELGLDRVDALLRVWPSLGETLFPVLAQLTTNEESSGALMRKLQENPPWRRPMLAAMPAAVKPPGLMASFYLEAMLGEKPLTNAELRPFLTRLISEGWTELAYSIWLASLPEERRPAAEGVANGEFDFPITGTGFDWRISKVDGAEVRAVTDQNRGRVLKVQFYDRRVPFRHLAQILKLAPGHHRLTGWSKASRLDSARGLHWTVRCYSGQRSVLGSSDKLRGTYPWSEFSMSFEVPQKDDCSAQVLTLELPARIAAEEEISGEIWFDSMRLEPDEVQVQQAER